jgi:glycine cleavage system H protein
MTVLLLAVTVAIFLGIDYLVQRSKAKAPAAAVRQSPVTALRYPEGIYFSKTHTWMNLFPSGTIQMGIDDFVNRMFVHPVLTLLKKEGDEVRKGEAIIRLQEGGNTLCVHSPIDGRITQRNTRLGDAAGATPNDSFVHGWAYQVVPSGGATELRNFFLGAETHAWMKTEFAKLRDFMATAAASQEAYGAVSLQDGGEPMPGMLSRVSPELCTRFEAQFLMHE